MPRTKGAKNKPKGIKAQEANGMNGHARITEEEFEIIAKKVEEIK